MIYLASATIAFGLTLWLSKFFLHYVDEKIFLDRPTLRKLHEEPVPRYGGIIFGLVILVFGAYIIEDLDAYKWYFFGAAAIFSLGAIDDYRVLSWKVKLPVQLLVGVAVAFHFLGSITTVEFFGNTLFLGDKLILPVFIFWFVGIHNALNLIDGMDGLAGGFMLLSSFTAVLIGWLNGAERSCLESDKNS